MNQPVEYVRICIARMTKNDRGASAVEYGLLIALIAIAIIVAITLLGGSLKSIFDQAAASITVS